MQQSGTNMIAKRVIWNEAAAIFFIIAITWLDEILDIPYVFLGGPATLINWRESIFEGILILIIGAIIIRHSDKLLVRVSYLQSIMPVCPSYKKIKVDKEFRQDIDRYIRDRAKSDFTYGICPDCKKILSRIGGYKKMIEGREGWRACEELS